MDAEERAENLARQAEEAEALSAIYGEDFAVEDGAWTVTGLSKDEVPLDYILEEMCIAVEIRKGVWNTPDPPPSLQGGFDGWGFANPLNLCQLGSNLFCNK